jgi:hypothetical protein
MARNLATESAPDVPRLRALAGVLDTTRRDQPAQVGDRQAGGVQGANFVSVRPIASLTCMV